MVCTACEAVYINGVLCHEQGCPRAYKDEVRECAWCGCEFNPEDKYQKFCSDYCAQAFYG